MGARRVVLVALLVSGATGCMHAARVFLDIPEGREEVAPEGSTVSEELLEALRPKPPDPAAIERVGRADSVLALLPELPSGGVDWTAAWRADVIRPRARQQPAIVADSADAFAYDLYLGGEGGPEAYFPHSTHRAWMDCVSCHPRVYRNGGASFDSEAAHEADSCGACHGPVAFQIQACELCHEAGSDLPSSRHDKSLGETLRMVRLAPSESGRIDRAGEGIDVSSFPPAIFPHGEHRLRYQCRACHESPFAMERGAASLSRDDAHSARACGACHDGAVAFGADMVSCDRCHVTARG